MTVTSTPPGIPCAPRLASREFLSRAGFAAGYAQRTGRDISRICYYMAFGCFKLAVVLEGVYARYVQHQTVGQGFEHEGLAVPTLAARAHPGTRRGR